MFWTNQKKQIEELKQRLKRQEQALKLKNEYISLQEGYISKVIDQSKLTQKHLFENCLSLDTYFSENFVFSQAREVLNSNFYWCKKIKDKILLITVDCGEGDAAGVIVQTHIFHLLEEYASFERNEFLKKLNNLVEVFQLEISLVVIEENNLEYWGNGIAVFEQKNQVFSVQGTNEIQEFTDVKSVYLFSKGIIEQPNHDDETIKYSQKQLLQFIQQNIHLSKAKQFLAWEDELDEWMGCCAKQLRNMLFLGIKL